ncbi:hypothetical protein VTJ49DRAFT_416 [Mycothermus thermophilus]|uniref:DUF833-domain-containing protein n=1 Tax=Humicola insolens TaxID=85995 RepID=A0ABR3VF57_HUMIN
MCIVLLTTAHPKYALVIIDNRDEFILRPTSRPHWWTAHPESHPSGPTANGTNGTTRINGTNEPKPPPEIQILSSRDLQREERGTWMGITKGGNFAVLTNYREINTHDAAHPVRGVRSRGGMVTAWLRADPSESTADFVHRLLHDGSVKGVGGFSLVCGKLRRTPGPERNIEPLAIISNRWDHPDEVPWICSQRGASVGLSNATYLTAAEESNGTLWPKIRDGRDMLRRAVSEAKTEDELVAALFKILDYDRFPPNHTMDLEEGLDYLKDSIFIPAFGNEERQREMREARQRGAAGNGREGKDRVAGSPPARGEQTNGFQTGLYGTQRQTIVLVDWDGNVRYTERALFDRHGNPIPRGEADETFRFKIDGWEEGVPTANFFDGSTERDSDSESWMPEDSRGRRVHFFPDGISDHQEHPDSTANSHHQGSQATDTNSTRDPPPHRLEVEDSWFSVLFLDDSDNYHHTTHHRSTFPTAPRTSAIKHIQNFLHITLHALHRILLIHRSHRRFQRNLARLALHNAFDHFREVSSLWLAILEYAWITVFLVQRAIFYDIVIVVRKIVLWVLRLYDKFERVVFENTWRTSRQEGVALPYWAGRFMAVNDHLHNALLEPDVLSSVCAARVRGAQAAGQLLPSLASSSSQGARAVEAAAAAARNNPSTGAYGFRRLARHFKAAPHDPEKTTPIAPAADALKDIDPAAATALNKEQHQGDSAADTDQDNLKYQDQDLEDDTKRAHLTLGRLTTLCVTDAARASLEVWRETYFPSGKSAEGKKGWYRGRYDRYKDKYAQYKEIYRQYRAFSGPGAGSGSAPATVPMRQVTWPGGWGKLAAAGAGGWSGGGNTITHVINNNTSHGSRGPRYRSNRQLGSYSNVSGRRGLLQLPWQGSLCRAGFRRPCRYDRRRGTAEPICVLLAYEHHHRDEFGLFAVLGTAGWRWAWDLDSVRESDTVRVWSGQGDGHGYRNWAVKVDQHRGCYGH